MDAEGTTNTASTLCTACSVLPFDDGHFGGAIENRHEKLGHRILAYSTQWQLQEYKLDYEYVDDLPELLKLKLSGEAGCAFCKALRSATLRLISTKLGRVVYTLRYNWLPSQTMVEWIRDSRLELHVNLNIIPFSTGDDGEPAYDEILVFMMECKPGRCQEWFQADFSPNDQPLCAENVAFIKKRLSYCTEYCDPMPENAFLPTRLLDLGAEDTFDDIKLIQCSSLVPRRQLRYATLSYCWGTKEQAAHQAKTNSLNLQQNMISISFETMTQVIKDAIVTTKALSLRYLWVDALCIIQGDEHDWTRESAEMAQVYRHAFVTICTLTTFSCNDSFLDRDPAVNVYFRSTIRGEIQGVYSLRLQPRKTGSSLRLQLGRTISSRGWMGRAHRDRMFGNWAERAWTFQEETLSPRILYFGSSRIHYKCGNERWEEGYFDDDPLLIGVSVTEMLFQSDADLGAETSYKTWLEVAGSYSNRELTDKRDRLPAISGLAKLMASKVDDTYIAGIWAGDFLQGLLWRTFETEESGKGFNVGCENTNEYIGPTWSWVTRAAADFIKLRTSKTLLDGNMTSLRSEWRSYNVSYTLEDKDLNPYGRMLDCKLSLEGKLAETNPCWGRIECASATNNPWEVRFNNNNYKAVCYLDGPQPEISHGVFHGTYLLLLASTVGGWPGYTCHTGTWDDIVFGCGVTKIFEWESDVEREVHEKLRSGTFDSFQIQEPGKYVKKLWERDSASERSDRNAWGIIVRQIGDGTYIRQGLFEVHAEEGGLNVFESYPFQRLEVV